MYTAAGGLTEIGVDVQTEFLGNLRNPLRILNARQRVRELSSSFDLVHAQYGSACAFVASASKVPLVLTIRGNDWNLHKETFGIPWLHTRLARAMTVASLKYYQMILCVSKRMCRELKTIIQPNCLIEYHPSPIDLSRWPIRVEPRSGPRPPYRLLFTANRLTDPIKRGNLIEEAVNIASRRIGKIELVCATGIPHNQMPALVASCDAVACTSETEGWPNSVKEALACGLPFVSTDVSDLRIIAETESSCRISETNPVSFAQSLCEVLTRTWTPGLRRHVEKMDLRKSSEQLKSLYEKIINEQIKK